MNKLKSVLIVDDEEIFIYLHSKIVGMADCCDDLVTFGHGTSVIDYLRQHEEKCEWPELMLVDINMPLMNGWELIDNVRKLRGSSSCGNIVTYVLSSSINPEDVERANHGNSVHGFVSKPLSVEALHSILDKHFPHTTNRSLPKAS